jgi:hypothetical protein
MARRGTAHAVCSESYREAGMSNREREERALRTIVVSAHSALRTAAPEAGERIKDRTDELLADLESIVIRDGGNESILSAIEHERRRLRD